jgi:dTDP-4-amino-4,6-dideoxygalactose transaminase
MQSVNKFEQKLAPWFGSENVMTVNNGTAALQLAIRLANVVSGDYQKYYESMYKNR